MPTVNKSIADKCILHKGVYPGDEHLPPIVKVIEYENAYGGTSYGLVYEHQNPDTYAETEFVRNPRVYWQRDVH